MRQPTALLVAAVALTQNLTAQSVGAALPVMTPPSMATQPMEVSRAFDAAELDRIVSPIALYPDPLLAQVLTAATFAAEIPTAARWVDARRGLTAQQLVDALAAERVTWDPSVQALVAFPTVLQMMATTMPWTEEIGQAFRTQHGDVMDAVQRLRAQAQRYGYLRSTPEIQVVQSPAIEILPVNPSYVVVPYYNPVVVFAPPRPRFLVSSAIYLGFGVRLGLWYEPWGWRSSGFHWPTHYVVRGYPGWNRHVYQVSRGYSYALPRSSPRSVVTPGGYYDPRRTGRDVDARVERDRPRSSHDVRDVRENRDNRDDRWSGRVAQPRVEQPSPRVTQPRDNEWSGRVAQPRVAQSSVTYEARRSNPQPQAQPQGSAESRPARAERQEGGGYRRRP